MQGMGKVRRMWWEVVAGMKLNTHGTPYIKIEKQPEEISARNDRSKDIKSHIVT